MPSSDPQTDVSIRTSHPWKILLFWAVVPVLFDLCMFFVVPDHKSCPRISYFGKYALPDSYLLAEGTEDGVAKVTSLERARD